MSRAGARLAGRGGALSIAGAIGSGLLCSAALPPWDQWLLAYGGLVPLLVAVRARTPGQAAWLGYLSGLCFYLATIWWVIGVMTTYGRMPLPLAVLALLLLCGVLAGYTAAFTWLLALGERWLRIPGGLRPLSSATLWAAIEFLRAHLFSGFPWMLFGYSQFRQPTIRLLAAATGVYGISALLVLVNATLAELIDCRRARGVERSCRWGSGLALGVMLLALGATLGYAKGIWQDTTAGAPVRVGLLQGNIDQSLKWDRAHQTATLDVYEGLARQAAGERPALVVWPETAVPFLLRREPALAGRLAGLVAETGVPMLIGSPDLAEDGLFYNAAFLVGTDRRIHGRYDKRHLVPFGEYVPLKALFFFVDRLAVGIGDFGRGRAASVLTADRARFGVMICYEAIFPGEVREFVAGGAEFLVNITNDAWFGRSGAPYQHLAMAAMRAVENGVFLVRAANTGVTAVVAPTGEILAETPLFTRAAITGSIRLRQGMTPYTRYGDVFAWTCLLFLLGYALRLGVAWRRGRSATRMPGEIPSHEPPTMSHER